MTESASLAERGVWWLRHAAARGLSIFDEAAVLLENVVAEDTQRLIILDDLFPSLATAFRIAEINGILSHFDTAIVYSTWRSRHGFRKYRASYPQFANRVRRFSALRRLRGSVAYVIFLNNIFQHTERLERARLPFAFELYPGGGFCLDEAVSDARLQRVLASPMFRKVIATQNVTRDYLLNKQFCTAKDIEFVFGGVLLSDVLREPPSGRVRYGFDKETIDICFVADKYTPRGVDKGYDRFIESAHILCGRYPQARFHVVGRFTGEDVDVTGLRSQIKFYGFQLTPFFPPFYSRMDIILSPNIPFLLSPGKFDGFPTGGSIEAALCGTAIFATDELGMNEGRLKDREEIVIVSREPNQIAAALEGYISNPERLRSLAQNGERAVRRLFSLEAQMTPRLRILSDLLSDAGADPST